MSFVLILGGEYPLRERVLAGALRAFGGGKVYTVAKHRAVPWLKFFDGVIDAEVTDADAVLAALAAHERATGERPAAVVPMNDFVVRTGLAVAQAYGLRYQSPEAVDLCRDKFRMKERLAARNLPVARFGAFSTLAELEALAATMTFPIVLKPREFAGSAGVLKVETKAHLAAAYRQMLRDVDGMLGAYHVPENAFQAEEYIPTVGEVSIEVANFDDERVVLAVTDKYLGAEPYFVEIGHSVPSRFGDDAKLRQLALDACAALGIDTGIAHVEARVMPDGQFRLIEVGARTGGDAIMDLVERVYGLNPYELHVAAYLGRRPRLPTHLQARGVSAVAFLKAPAGTIRGVHALARPIEGLVSLNVTAKPGDVSEPPLSWRAREGTIELFWPDLAPSQLALRHLRLADELATALFTVEPAPSVRAAVRA
jgi:biotin carboxylase